MLDLCLFSACSIPDLCLFYAYSLLVLCYSHATTILQSCNNARVGSCIKPYSRYKAILSVPSHIVCTRPLLPAKRQDLPCSIGEWWRGDLTWIKPWYYPLAVGEDNDLMMYICMCMCVYVYVMYICMYMSCIYVYVSCIYTQGILKS